MQITSEPKLTIYNSSAGSGKTYTLATEFIRFALEDEQNYSRILAITFTNKATAEMKERILKFLQVLSKNEDDDLMQLMVKKTNLSEKQISIRSATVLKNILHNYSFFSVNTIDSFFQRLIKSFAAELNIYINYEVLLDTQEVVEWVVDEMLVRSFEDDKLKSWIQKYVYSKIENESSIFSIKDLFENVSRDVFNNIHKSKIESNHDALKELSSAELLLKELTKEKQSFENAMDALAQKGLEVYKANGISADDFSYKKSGVGSIFNKVSKENKKYDIGSRVLVAHENPEKWLSRDKSELLPVVQSHLAPLLSEIIEYKENHIAEYQSSKEILKNIYAFGITNFLEELKEEYIKENNLLLLSDSVQHISDLIKEQEDAPFLYDKIGTYFNYILLDESQDTSQSQWRNLLPLVKNCLSEGGEVIVVGDIKQSIYRWRGGDINLLTDGIKQDAYPFETAEKHLSTNYRSTVDVVSSNNALLEKCLSSLSTLGYTDVDRFYENYQQEAFLKKTGYVTYSKIDVEKDFIGSSLNLMLERIEQLTKEQNYTFGDITILVRYNKESAKVAEFLKLHNIPILSSEALYIQNSEEVKFIISLLKGIQTVKDDISRAFVMNYLDIDLKSTKGDLFVAALPKEFGENLSEIANLDSYLAVERIISIFKLQQKSPAYLVELLNLILDFSSKNSSSILSFLDYWDEKIVDGKQSINVPEGENAVNIVSVHKSKGLEYPIVIIPFANWGLTPHKNTIFWFDKEEVKDDKSQLYFPLSNSKNLSETTFNGQYKHELSLNILDELNALYVAITRAANELHVHIRYQPEPKKKPVEVKLNDMSALLFHALKDDFPNAEPLEVLEFGERTQGEEQEIDFDNTIKVDVVSINVSNTEINLINKEDDEARAEGKLLHTIFEDIADFKDWKLVKQKLLLSGDADDEEVKEIEEIVHNVLQISDYSKWLSGGYTIFNEMEIFSESDNRVYRPDKLFIKDDEVIIVDFKIRYNESSASKYKRQLLSYKEVLLKMGYNKIEPYLLYLKEAELTKVG